MDQNTRKNEYLKTKSASADYKGTKIKQMV